MTRLVDFALVTPDSCGENISTDALATGGASLNHERGRYMPRKLTLLAISCGILLILAVPAMASAHVLNSEGQALAVGSGFKAASSDVSMVGQNGTLGCGEFVLRMEVQQNGTIQAEAFSDGEASECERLSNHSPLSVRWMEAEEVTLLSEGRGSALLSFEYQDGPYDCTDVGTVSLSFTPGSSSFHMSGALEGRGAGACLGQEIEGDFALTYEEGLTPVTLL